MEEFLTAEGSIILLVLVATLVAIAVRHRPLRWKSWSGTPRQCGKSWALKWWL